jgi:NAD(P)-dependent dehydrogenase (short-subunit alcohol dehydrogenase family)
VSPRRVLRRHLTHTTRQSKAAAMPNPSHTSRPETAWIITGPTSGMGHVAALELARHGTVVLVGRDPDKLNEVEAEITALPGGSAVSVVCDFSDIHSVHRAAREIVALNLPLAGLANNAGMMSMTDGGLSAQGWDLSFATNHLGPFAFTEQLIPHLPDGATVVFTCSAVEDPERKPAVTAGFRGGRYISAEASARGQWAPDGSKKRGYDAYATSKQGNLATVFAFARQYPRLRFRAVEPGFNPGTGLGRDVSPVLQFIAKRILAPMAPMIKYWSTPKLAGRLIAAILTDPSDATGIYYDEKGNLMQGSKQVSDPAFSDRYAAETRELLATVLAETK